MIMSYEEGVSISEFIATGNKDWNKKLAGLVLNTFLKVSERIHKRYIHY